jgi:hypothetical protein
LVIAIAAGIRDEEWRTLRNYYKGKFFSIRMHTAKSAVVHWIIQYTTVKPTPSSSFRFWTIYETNELLRPMFKRCEQVRKTWFWFKNNKAISLTTHNAKADAMNAKLLEDLKGEADYLQAGYRRWFSREDFL